MTRPATPSHDGSPRCARCGCLEREHALPWEEPAEPCRVAGCRCLALRPETGDNEGHSLRLRKGRPRSGRLVGLRVNRRALDF